MDQALVFILAASLRELFPSVEIVQNVATPECFFCDFVFPEEFSTSMFSPIEERMRQWVGQKLPFNLLTMMPSNAAEMLEHRGDKKLAQKVQRAEGEVVLLQLDRFFFQVPYTNNPPVNTGEVVHFKLVCFWLMQGKVRLIGVRAPSKKLLKEQAHHIKNVQNPQKTLEEQGYVSWVGGCLIWEPRAEAIKAKIRKKIVELYQEFDEVSLPMLSEREQQNLLMNWVNSRKRGGFRFQNRPFSTSDEPWDHSICPCDFAWGVGRMGADITSYLHLITKFLTIFSFKYEIVSVGRMDADLERVLEGLQLSWTSCRGKGLRLEFQVVDQLGRRWTLSTLEWDQKKKIVQATLCVSLERCVALLVETKTLLNRLEQLEN